MTSTRGKLHVLQKHYKDFGRISEDNLVCAVVYCVKMSI